MSEPVGNGPRGLIPANSFKERESQQQSSAQREPVERIVTGKVITRKQPWYSRAARGMVSDDAHTIGDYVLMEIVVPTLKNLLREVVVGSLDRTLFGASNRAALGRTMVMGRPSSAGGIRTKYDHMNANGDPRDRPMSPRARANHEFEEILLTDREEALSVISRLMDEIARYNVATVADLYNACGKSSGPADRNWGWKDLSEARAEQYRGHWLIKLPDPIPLRD